MVQEDRSQELLGQIEAQIALVAEMPETVAGKSTEKVRSSLRRFFDAVSEYYGRQQNLPLCTGTIRSGGARNLRAGPGIHYAVAGTVLGDSEVEVYEARFTDEPDLQTTDPPTLVWNRIRVVDGGQEGWIWQAFVIGCNDLGLMPGFFQEETDTFQEEYDVGEAVLPVPPSFDTIPPCIEGLGTDEARWGCSAQVYYRFYHEFLGQNGEPPRLRDLFAAVFRSEFPSSVSIMPYDDRVDALVNNYLNFCGDGCSSDRLIDWLASKQGWYDFGRRNYSLPESDAENTELDAIDSVIQSDPADLAAGHDLEADLTTLEMPQFELGDEDGTIVTSVDWATYPYSTNPDSPYYKIREGSYTPIACEIVRRWQLGQNGDYIFSYWEDYISAIVDKENLPGPIGIYNMETNETPDWVIEGRIPEPLETP